MTLQLFTLVVMPLLGLAIATIGYVTIVLTEPAQPHPVEAEAPRDHRLKR